MNCGDEFDAFTRWRRVLRWRAGERRAIKRRYNRRARRQASFDTAMAALFAVVIGLLAGCGAPAEPVATPTGSIAQEARGPTASRRCPACPKCPACPPIPSATTPPAPPPPTVVPPPPPAPPAPPVPPPPTGALACDPAALGLQTGKRAFPLPALPKLGAAAGDSILDPTFGTTIVRATDASDGTACSVAYSYWPTFNLSGTRFHVLCSGGAWLKTIGPTGAIIREGLLFVGRPPGGGSLGWEDSIWSGLDPDVIYGHEGRRIWSYNVATHVYTLVVDLAPALGPGGLWQMSKSTDDGTLAGTLRGPGGNTEGYFAWTRGRGVVLDVRTTQLDEVQVDKGGKYVYVQVGDGRARVANLDTGAIVDLSDGAPDFAAAHEDAGYGFVVGHDDWNNRVTWRTLAEPKVHRSVLDFGQDWSANYHTSMLGDGDKYAALSFYGAAASAPYAGAIVLLALDGSKTYYPIAHHRSTGGGYENMPRANISRDGCSIAFTSNWGGARRDVFIAQMPEKKPAPKGNRP